MNKMIKGSIAGATGVALLMGGFGTYALWSDTEQLSANGVTSGVLTIDTTAGYYDDSNNPVGTPASPDWVASDLMVPGDTITYTQTFTVVGTGKNLEGGIELAPLGGTNGFSTLTRSVDVVDSGTGAADITKVDADSFTFSSDFGSATLTATVTYVFPAGNESLGTTDQNKSFNTPAANFTISQS